MFKILAMAALLWSLPVLALASDYRITGHAYQVDDLDNVLYRERYTEVDDDGKAEVHYYSADDERVAEKQLDYSRGETQPSYTLKDFRNDLLWSVEWDSDSQLMMRKGSIDDPDRSRVSSESPQVIDAGFDGFVKQEWDKLMDGERVTFYFAFPNRLRNVRLRGERIDASDSGIEKGESDWIYFRIQVNSRLLSLFADDLYLAYEEDGKRLKVFRGRSNLPDADGESIDVEIHYEYH